MQKKNDQIAHCLAIGSASWIEVGHCYQDRETPDHN